MAIDDNTNYTLTGAQVKDLAQRIQSGGGGGSNAVILYSGVSFHTPIQLVDIYSDAALTTTVTGATVKGYIEAGKTVAIIYETSVSDVPQNETLIITSCDNHSEAARGVIVFTGTFFDYANSEPVLYTLACDQPSNLWSAAQKSIPTNTSDLVNDGSDGTSTYVEADDLAAVATSGSYNDLTNLPSDRLFRMLVPTGTEITSNKNLNTVEFLVVGRYYCSANATVATLTNCPTSSAFMLEVFSPLSTTIDDETTRAWCYRTRILTTFTGEMFVQSCSTNATPNNWSYGSWSKINNVQADWNASSGLSQILNRPGVKNATAATHTDYNNNQDYLPNMRFLSFWNGAYNSSGNSNLTYLASNAVKTANINNSAVTTDKINGSAVTKAKMHGMPCPDYSNAITSWGTINSSTSKTVSADGFIVGKAIVTGTDKQALVSIGGRQVGGIPYNATSQINNLQVAFCLPVKSGTSVTFTCSGGTGGYFQGCALVGWQM